MALSLDFRANARKDLAQINTSGHFEWETSIEIIGSGGIYIQYFDVNRDLLRTLDGDISMTYVINQS